MGCSPFPFYIFGCDSSSASKPNFQWFLTACLCFILSPILHILHTSHAVWHSLSEDSRICHLKGLNLLGFFLLPHVQWLFPFVLRHLPCESFSLSPFPPSVFFLAFLLSLPSPRWGFPLFPCASNKHYSLLFLMFYPWPRCRVAGAPSEGLVSYQ